MNIDPYKYTITIQKIDYDGDEYFEGTVRELPDVRTYGENYDEAYQLVVDTISTAAELYEESNRSFPSPLTKKESYSGRVTLRLPKSLHASVTQSAEYEGVSINSYIVSILAEYTGRLIGECTSNDNNSWFTVSKTSASGNSKLAESKTLKLATDNGTKVYQA